MVQEKLLWIGKPIPTFGITFEDRDKLALALHTGASLPPAPRAGSHPLF